MPFITNKKANQIIEVFNLFENSKPVFKTKYNNRLTKNDFKFDKIHDGYRIELKDNSKYFFKIWSNEQMDTYRIESFPTNNANFVKWEDVGQYFMGKWFPECMKEKVEIAKFNDEMSEPNLWDELIRSNSYPIDDFKKYDKPFTNFEKDNIKDQLDEIKFKLIDEIKNKEHSKDSINQIEITITYLSEKVDKLSKLDWRSVFVAMLINLSIDTSLGNKILVLIKENLIELTKYLGQLYLKSSF